MYRWLVLLHVIGVFGFMMAHGISAGVAFGLRRERRFEHARALLELSASSYGVMYLSLLVLLVTGIITGFMGQWWGRGWIWVSLGLLVIIIVAMVALGSSIYGTARKLAGLPYFEGGRQRPPIEPASAEEIDAILSRGHPMLLTLIGFGGIVVLSWLMIFKPF